MKTACLLLPFVLGAVSVSLAQPSPPPATAEAAIHVVTYLDLLPSQADAGRVLLVQQTQAERRQQGCRSSELLQEQGRANHFMLVETWDDATGLEGYHATEAYRQFRASLQPALASPLDERRGQQIASLKAEGGSK